MGFRRGWNSHITFEGLEEALRGPLEKLLGLLRAGPLVLGFVVCIFVYSCLVFSNVLSPATQILFYYFRKFGHNYLELFLPVKIRIYACDSLNRKLLLIFTRFISHFISHLNQSNITTLPQSGRYSLNYSSNTSKSE